MVVIMVSFSLLSKSQEQWQGYACPRALQKICSWKAKWSIHQ